jgi:hypothetical protein
VQHGASSVVGGVSPSAYAGRGGPAIAAGYGAALDP